MPVTAEDLSKEVKDYSWTLLTGDNNSTAERCLDKARIWLKAKMVNAQGAYNEEDEIQRLILLKRALYELYSFAEQEAVAADKKEDAMELLKAYLGSSVDSSGYASGTGQTPIPCGAIKKHA